MKRTKHPKQGTKIMTNQTFNTNLLNNVKNVFVAWAKSEKIDLAKNFKTRDEFLKFLIAFTFKFCIENLNMSQDDALNLILGEQTVNQLAEQVWNKFGTKLTPQLDW